MILTALLLIGPDDLWSTAHAIPKETTSEGSGYFSLVEGRDGRIYVGTAKYGSNAYLVAFDPRDGAMETVVDCMKEIGSTAGGFAAQAKIHTRNNVGASGRIYFGTKQGYPKEGEKRADYPGGHSMVFDPATGKTRVYPVAVPQQGIISVTPDEARGVAYLSTCSDERPTESTHFMILDLATGKTRDLMDARHMYAFIVVDHLGRAYHPILGGGIARYDPRNDRLETLKQTIDGKPPSPDSLLAHPESHPINWEVSPDRKTLWSVAMSGNALYRYDLTGEGDTLAGRSLGPLVAGARATDCRALCVGPDGTVWAGVNATDAGGTARLRLVCLPPGAAAVQDRGAIAVRNPDFTEFVDRDGKALPAHHGFFKTEDGTLRPRYSIMAIAAARDGAVYLTTLCPFTLHEIRFDRQVDKPRVAVVATVWYQNSHADVIASRLVEGHTLDGKGEFPRLALASAYVDQRSPRGDKSRALAERHGFAVHDTVEKALTLGTGALAVDGVLLIAEHGDYPESPTGSVQYPKRRLFGEIVKVFESSGRVVPVFIDKHLEDDQADIAWVIGEARRLKIPLMAGSSLPVLWRRPEADVPRGAELREIVATSYHRLDAYGFHALEMVQCLVERRKGGETGVRRVRTLSGAAVWEAGDRGEFDLKLLEAAYGRCREEPLPAGKAVRDVVREPVLFMIEYVDGLRAAVLTMDGSHSGWAAAWRAADGAVDSTLFWAQEARPFMHFTYLVKGVEQMMWTGRPAWPVERTLLTSGALDALLVSRREGGRTVETPHLAIPYRSTWTWRMPPPPPPDRPLEGP